MNSAEETGERHITNALAMFCSLYLTMAAESNGFVSPQQSKLIADYLSDRAWWGSGSGDKQQKLMESDNFTEEELEKLVKIAMDYEQQAREETSNLHRKLLDAGGPEAVIKNYSFLVGLLGDYKEKFGYLLCCQNGHDPKNLEKLYHELTQIAMAQEEANISSSQKILLDKTAEAWDLKKI